MTPILEGLPSQQVDAIDRFVRGQMHTAGLPGLALTVTSGAEALYGGGFGATRVGGSPMTPDTCCQIGSTTKSMTAAAVLQLRHRGRLDLDAPVTTYRPGRPQDHWP